MSHTAWLLLRRPALVVTGWLELEAGKAHVGPSVLPIYTSAALCSAGSDETVAELQEVRGTNKYINKKV